MASEIKVDTIVNAGGDNDTGIDLATNDQILLKVANATKLTMNSTGQTTIVGEGGTTTTSVQQGLAKAFVNHDASVSVDDSFNILSVVDSGTGHFGVSFTANMANSHYIGSGSNLGSTSSFASGMTSDGASITTGRMDYQFRNFDTVNPTDQAFNRVIAHGDLA